jgi:dihydropteroate synthase
MIWRCREHSFDLDRKILVMGVVNVTPDSFSDGGRFLEPGAAIEAARRHLAEGADLVDLGDESTRPGSEPVPAAEQLRRLMPVVEGLAATPGICISVDTSSAEVAGRALAAGAHVVNDVRALADPAMAEVIARSGAGCVLMHMRGTPATMQEAPRYEDVVGEVGAWLEARLKDARAAGIAEECVALDPGIGFGKTAEHNLELLARLDELAGRGRPLLIGVSRKSFIGRLLDQPVDRRLEGGLAATAVALFLGAGIVRTHDVEPTVRVAKIATALRAARRVPHATR